MANKGMRDVTLVLDGVNEQRIEAEGDFIHVQTANAAIQIRADEGPFFTRFQSQGNRVYYKGLVVKSATPQTVTLQVGYGYATDARATIAAPVFNVTVAAAVNNPANADVPCPGGGVQTSICAASANNIGVMLSLPSNAAGPVRIGDNTAAAAAGFQMEPGDKVVVSTQAQLFAFNNNAGAVTMTLTRLRNI